MMHCSATQQSEAAGSMHCCMHAAIKSRWRLQTRLRSNHAPSLVQSWVEMKGLNEDVRGGASPADRVTSQSDQVVIRGTDGAAADCSLC